MILNATEMTRYEQPSPGAWRAYPRETASVKPEEPALLPNSSLLINIGPCPREEEKGSGCAVPVSSCETNSQLAY
jgi:hypothetical protein